MLLNIKNKDQNFTIKELSKKTKLSKNEISQGLIEMGIGFLVMVEENKLETILEIRDELIKDPHYNIIAKHLHKAWKDGQKNT